ncbi:MAG: helix-turn-helix domain-containing protein [Pseudomonadota bacterium]
MPHAAPKASDGNDHRYAEMANMTNVAVIDYPGALKSAVHGIEEILSFAGTLRSERNLKVRITGEPEAGFDVYILPPTACPIDLDKAPQVPRLLAKEHAKGALMCSVCAGLTWLAAADIPGPRPVTTHWELSDAMAKRFPGLHTDADPILIEYSDLITAGGMMAWVDLCLALIERFVDRDAMIEVAQKFVVDIGHRDQRRYKRFVPDLGHQDSALRRAQMFIERNYNQSVTVSQIAKVAGMSDRSLIRRFKGQFGLSPMAYVQTIRIEKAKDALLHSAKSIQTIAFDAGYSDHSAFSRRFMDHTGMTPNAFRSEFDPRPPRDLHSGG